mmetsp:Transcript_12245/g.33020  ORF Transcript_12245/g.33020 Transcript_12245/m.33020 type:complete len:82 (+) Transcript_12245:219-464(+)
MAGAETERTGGVNRVGSGDNVAGAPVSGTSGLRADVEPEAFESERTTRLGGLGLRDLLRAGVRSILRPDLRTSPSGDVSGS